MSDLIAAKEKELELLKAEQAFVDAKEAGTVTVSMKADLRALRQEYREKYRPTVNAGKAGATPATVKAKAKV